MMLNRKNEGELALNLAFLVLIAMKQFIISQVNKRPMTVLHK